MASNTNSPQPRTWLAIGFLVLVIGGAIAWFGLNWGYGEVSPKGYAFATALYSICNQQDEARLEKFSQMVTQAKSENELRPDEARWIEGIIAQGKKGNWSAASKNARRLMMDQVKR